jgi:hypothetical protein
LNFAANFSCTWVGSRCVSSGVTLLPQLSSSHERLGVVELRLRDQLWEWQLNKNHRRPL